MDSSAAITSALSISATSRYSAATSSNLLLFGSLALIRAASADTVRVAKMSATITDGVSSQVRIRATTWVASTESPPTEKKSSSAPMLSRPRTSPTMLLSADSSGVAGAR